MIVTIARSWVAVAVLACLGLGAPATAAELAPMDPERIRVGLRVACDSLHAAITAAQASAETTRVDVSPQGWTDVTKFPTTVDDRGSVVIIKSGGTRTTPRAAPGYHSKSVLIDPAIGESLVVRSAAVAVAYLDFAYRYLDSSKAAKRAEPEWARPGDLIGRAYRAAPRIEQQQRIVLLVNDLVTRSSSRRGESEPGSVGARELAALPRGWASDYAIEELAGQFVEGGRSFCAEVRAGGKRSGDAGLLPFGDLLKAVYIDCWTTRRASLESDGLWRCVLAALERDAKHGGVANAAVGLRASLVLNDSCFQRLLDGVATGCATDPFRGTGIMRENGPGDTLATLLDMTERIERNLRLRSYSGGADGWPALRAALDLLVSRLNDAVESSALGACCSDAIASWIGVLDPMRLAAGAGTDLNEGKLAGTVREVRAQMQTMMNARSQRTRR